jgi:tetratricopeptide (TPR) repeat protein
MHLLRALSLQPRNDRAQGYLGSVYLQQKRFAEASRVFQGVLKLNPTNQSARYNLGLIALIEEKPAEALPYFEKVHQNEPSDISALVGMLESQLLLKRQPAARVSAEKLKALLKPQDPRLFQAATLLALHGEYTLAIPLMEQVRQEFPQSYDVNYNLALVYFRSENPTKAAETLQSLLAQQPRAEAYNLLAAVEEKRQHYLEAVRAYQKAAEMEPGNEDYRYDYANELLQHRTNQEAITLFAAGVRDFPRSWKLRLGLGCAYYLAGKFDEAARVLLETIKIEPNNKLAYFFLGKTYESTEPFQGPIREAFKAYLERNPDDSWAYFHFGNILYLRAQLDARPDFGPAKSTLNQALVLNPGFAEAYLQLGIILQQEGQLEESIPFLDRAIQSNPKLPAAHYRLAVAYKRLGRNEKAKPEFDLYEKLKSGNQAEQEKQQVIQFLVEQRK